MALKTPNATSLDYIEKIKKYKQKRTFAVILIIVFSTVIFLYIVNKIFVKDYNDYEVLSSTARADSNTVSYIKYGKNLLKYSRDGAAAYNSNSELIWNGSYNMKSPSVDIAGEYVLIGDIGSKEVCVFNGKGDMKKLEFHSPIASAKVAKQGVIAVLMNGEDANIFEIHNPFQTGDTMLLDKQIPIKQNGFVIDMDISEDGTKLVLSFLSVEKGIIGSNTTFYNFNNVYASENYFAGSFMHSQTVMPKVEFMDNNIVAVIGDNKLALYTMRQVPAELKIIELENEIRSIFTSSKYLGFIFENYEDGEKYKLNLYNLDGEVVLDQTIDYEYSQILMSGEEIIFLSELECSILKTNGRLKFHGKFDSSMSFMMPINNFNKYFIVNNVNIEKIKLVEEK